MPTTRKKAIKTVYEDNEESEQEKDGHDFSDSGSDAVITENSSSDDEEECQISSDEDFKSVLPKSKRASTFKNAKKSNITKSLISKINKQNENEENIYVAPVLFSVKNLTAADKLLPSILYLSESDSSDDDECPRATTKTNVPLNIPYKDDDSENENKTEYKDVWAKCIQDDSEEIAKKAFLELQHHKSKIEETKMSIQNYTVKMDTPMECDVKELLALGEEELPQPSISSELKKGKKKIIKDDSDSEMEDWEEVKEAKAIPQQGLQLIVDIPNAVCKKTKKVDVEMMMKRKMNRVKKEYQVYLHKVHVLCWLGHGNYVSGVLNDQTIMAAALSLVPSKECYPGERVDMKYIEQITSWFKDKVTLKQDKHENKFRLKPPQPPLRDILQQQIKSKVFTTKKYIVFVFVSMLRSLGLQCRVMFNFVTLPIKPPSSELCSLSTKPKDINNEIKKSCMKDEKSEQKKESNNQKAKDTKQNIPQLDGNYDMSCSSDSDNVMQLDGSDDGLANKGKKKKTNADTQSSTKHLSQETELDDSVSPPKRARRSCRIKSGKVEVKTINKKIIATHLNSQKLNENANRNTKTSEAVEKSRRSLSLKRPQTQNNKEEETNKQIVAKNAEKSTNMVQNFQKTKNKKIDIEKTIPKPDLQLPSTDKANKTMPIEVSMKIPKIIVSNETDNLSSKYFDNDKPLSKSSASVSRNRSKTSEPKQLNQSQEKKLKEKEKVCTKSIQNNTESKYFNSNTEKQKTRKTKIYKIQIDDTSVDNKRISHKDLKNKPNVKNDVTDDLIHIIKQRVKDAKADSKKLMVKGKIKKESDEDSDYLPVQSPKLRISESDDDFKPKKGSLKSKLASKKVDRRVISTDDESLNVLNKIDVWCEVFIEELEEWIAVDVIKGNVHCANEIYNRATHPMTYAVGWDNNNYLKDLTRRYVPHWNTVTRKQRVEPLWWNTAIEPWLGPKTARDREENERLDRMQLEAPLPKTIAEYKNHPLYALKRHLLKFEAIYPPDAATLGFVRGEPVYARECVYVCRSRDTWLKEAKVVKLAEQPYKVVKARPKWDKLSNKVITDKPLEVFGPWQVQDYEPPTAENGIVPRNAYGNVELFKDCMLPKGTVHIKLPGLNRIAKKLSIDCAPAMTGFDFNGGWSHPVYEGFVVCEEFGDIIKEAWIMDQEDLERKEQEKTEARVYGNWRRLIRGLLIKERLKAKYGFKEPSTSQDKKKKGPSLVVKKKHI